MGSLGVPELIFIFVLALLIFGPRKLPELGRNIGRALGEFRRASTDLRSAMEDEMRELDQQAREVESKAHEALNPAEPQPMPPEAPVGSGCIDPGEPGRSEPAGPEPPAEGVARQKH